MVITNETPLPEFEELKVEECNLGTPFLLAAAFHLGKQCEAVNNVSLNNLLKVNLTSSTATNCAFLN